VAADTMNHWIEGHAADLQQLLAKINCLIINEDEARLLAKEYNLIKAAQTIVAMGLDAVVIKKGESGSMTYNRNNEMFLLPAWPAADVKDPTGAGDSFAGAFMGYLAQQSRMTFSALKKAAAYGTVVASFTIADFSLQSLTKISRTDIDRRFEALRKLTVF
jgi:sugar/nucleoside kinase (ribokinase family)